jgi:AraC family transcriptional activator of pobA
MTETNQNNKDKHLKIFTIKKHSELLSADIIPPNFHSILFVISDSIEICIDNKHKTFLTSDLILIPSNIKFHILDTKTKIKLYIISFSSKLIQDSNLWHFRFCFLSAQNFTIISLNPEDISFLKKIFKLIYTTQDHSNHQFQKDLLGVGFNFLMQKSIDSQQIHKEIHSQKQKIIFRFFRYLKQNCKKERQVKYYADLLCITPGYLNKIIKELTNKTTKQLIEEALIIEIKLLLSCNQFTISEIAEKLHFSSCSSFSTFFKKHTSLSPTTYRSGTIR